MKLCVPFFISNHANAVKIDTFRSAEKLENTHKKGRKMAICNE
jgi:hypothetical protein